MKKKIKDIVVDEKYYKWSVQEKFWPEGYLKVWIDGHKDKPWLVVEFSKLEPVTPSLVAFIVKQACKTQNTIMSTESNKPNCRYENSTFYVK